ncbi:hypothetical protein [Hyalangium versicolor]|uniref:hypothetical protein n=1 Tax=Hyalangium versicolor TaxID=2861190 RepID=UPI001CCBF659|nr:hypothetical protein [Hyalangium versicolor]
MSSTAPALVVPMRCEALVVNEGVKSQHGFRWWTFNYMGLQHFHSPEPVALDGGVGGQKPGVYLHWTLPAELRQSTQDSITGTMSSPLVPNRYLVVRLSGTAKREARAWVLESDCPFTAQVKSGDVAHSSEYLVDEAIVRMWAASGDPYRTSFKSAARDPALLIANLGVAFDGASGWKERAATCMFLQAIAPANPHFSGYFPHHQGVFGFYDELHGVDHDTLSYYVIGWYSDPARDAETLAKLGFTRAAGAEGAATRSLYSGAVFQLAWDRKGAAPSPDPIEDIHTSGRLNVAIANNTIDAFSALVSQQVKDPDTSALLRAFNYDLLPILNDINGDALLEERIRQEWFSQSAGGYRWAITDRKSDGGASTELTAEEASWLQELNVRQGQLDAALEEVFSLQWRLSELWHKKGYLGDKVNVRPEPPIDPDKFGPFLQELEKNLDPDQQGSVAAGLVQKLGHVKGLLAQVPQPRWENARTREEALQAGILAFAELRALHPSKILKAVAAPRYYRAKNPVVILSGVEPPYAPDPGQATTVRTSTQLVTALQASGKTLSRATAGAAMPVLPGLAALPDLVGALFDELFLLDVANATALAAAVGLPSGEDLSRVMKARAPGTYQPASCVLPAMPLDGWSQPWAPLFLEWKGAFLPIPGDGGAWTFDGTEYHFNGSGEAQKPVQVGGISLLSPHAQFVFGSRLKKFLQEYGAGQSKLADLSQQIEKIFHWKFLAQELVGFHDSLALRDGRAHRRPLRSEAVGRDARSIAELMGHDDGQTGGRDALPRALRGRVSSLPLIPNGEPPVFQGIRQGQFYFSDLMLYDRFGRVLSLISSNTSSGLHDFETFPAVVDPALVPAKDKSLKPRVHAMVELPPRPIQGGRIDLQLVDKSDDTRLLSEAPDACPVCAFLIPNHLEGSLLVHAPDGRSLGEMRLVVGRDGVTRTAEWAPSAHGDVKGIEELEKISPHLARMLGAQRFQSEAGFRAFLGAIDATLWTIDPIGGRADQDLSTLVGRPLALVRARLQLQLQGAPFRDTGWDATFDKSPPGYLSQKFALRVGDQATRQDGTLGYYADAAHDSFNSVAAPDAALKQDYVKPIGPLGKGQNYLHLSFQEGTSAFVTLLVDPRAEVHIATGMFPIKKLTIPPRFVDEPLSRLEIGFRMGPILTAVRAPLEKNAPPAITYPRPAEQGGEWSWWELDKDQKPVPYDMLKASTHAELPPEPTTLRDGIAQLVTRLKPGT